MQRIQYDSYGGPENMYLADFDLPTPGAGEVAVKVAFAAINPIDWKQRNGEVKMVTGKRFPRALGMDLSGTVIAVGHGVTRFAPGDAVFGLARFKESGALAQSVVTRSDFLARKPHNLSFEEAACLGTPGITAWNVLLGKTALRPGAHMFVTGCGGAIGEAVAQLARVAGVTVSGSCGAGDIARMTALGLREVYDYRKTRPADIPGGFDAVLDAAAVLSVSTGMAMLRPGGVLMDLNPKVPTFLRALVDRRLKPVIASPRADILDAIAEATSQGRFRIRVGETVSLDNAIRLITELEKGRRLGGKGVVAME